jgi:BMFP domain-containing protein YqiC
MNNFFDDISKITGSALGNAMSMKQEFDNMMKTQMEQVTAKMGFITKEEFSVLNNMYSKLLQENEDLKKRVAILEETTKNKKE